MPLKVATTIQWKQINYLDTFIGFIGQLKLKLVNWNPDNRLKPVIDPILWNAKSLLNKAVKEDDNPCGLKY